MDNSGGFRIRGPGWMIGCYVGPVESKTENFVASNHIRAMKFNALL